MRMLSVLEKGFLDAFGADGINFWQAMLGQCLRLLTGHLFHSAKLG